MLKEMDEIDRSILNRIRENQGSSIRGIIKPFLLEKSESAMRARIAALELRQLIRLKKTKHSVLCFRNPAAEDGSDE
jgi:hypothetical protein